MPDWLSSGSRSDRDIPPHSEMWANVSRALQERRDHEIAVRLAEETGGGVEELTPSLKRSSSGEWKLEAFERIF